MDDDLRYRAVRSRDPRFDGRFVTAVTSTRIYCRPSCPAVTPRRAHVRFYPTAAAAQAAGFRACKRCRPDAVPGSPEWPARADLVARAMRLIADGVVDRDGVPGLAGRLGYSERQVHRQLVAEVGAGPLALARAQRAHTARLLLETTDLPLADVAFAAGFGSVRQFNDTVREVFAATPRALRGAGATGGATAGTIALRLPVRAPFAADRLFGFLRRRAVPGLEEPAGAGLRRSLALPHGPATVTLEPGEGHVRAVLRLADVRDLQAAVARCRRLLDLDADPVAVDAALAADPVLAPLVAAGPGLRVPGTVDGFEVAVRTVLGQQVSVAAARRMCAGLVDRLGAPLGAVAEGGVVRAFPTPRSLAAAGELPLPATRAGALRALAAAVAGGRLDLAPGADRADCERGLGEIPGIGPWTVAHVRMRGLADPDAFPATDLSLRRAAAAIGVSDLVAAAGRWRPWRAYATVHLWTTLARGERP